MCLNQNIDFTVNFFGGTSLLVVVYINCRYAANSRNWKDFFVAMQILSCLGLVCDTDSVYRMKYICPSLLSALQDVQRIPSFLGFQFFAFFRLLAVLPNNKYPGPPFLKNTVFLHHLLFAHFPSQAQEPGRCYDFDLCCWERASRSQRWSPATKPC